VTEPRGRLAPLLLLVLLALAACAQLSPSPSGTASPRASLGLDADSGLPLVALADLPPEATELIGLIEVGGPYPFAQDGTVFENREGILPDADAGYYHEYTVPTPGSADRGARRIVVGGQGEAYWTDDHYASFARIAP